MAIQIMTQILISKLMIFVSPQLRRTLSVLMRTKLEQAVNFWSQLTIFKVNPYNLPKITQVG
jgi:hypothetical protein